MITTITHLGNQLTLLLLTPNVRDDDALRITYGYESAVDAGTSGRENREPQHGGVRLVQTCFFTLSKTDAAALHSALPVLGDNLVGMPIWTDKLTGAQWADRIHTGGYLVRLSDGAVLAADAVLDDVEEYAPLLVGKLVDLPEIAAWTLDSGEGSITLTEDSPPDYAITINAAAVAGTWPAGLDPRWTRVINRAADGRSYEQVGRGREQAIEGRETSFRWGQEADFLLKSRDEIRSLLAFFDVSQGRLGALTMPWWFQPSDDTPETPHETKVRFAADNLQLVYTSGATAETTIAVLQLPWEVAAVAGETPEQAPRAYLYKFSLDVPGGPLLWRYTDWRDPVTIDEGSGDVTYIPGKIEHDQIAQGYQLDDSGVNLTVANPSVTHPLVMAVKQMLEAPLALEIREVDPNNAATTGKLKFSGEIGEPRSQGRKIKADTSVLGGALDVKVPNFYFQRTCNHDFCDAGCTLLDADWTFAGTLVTSDGILLEVNVTANPPGATLVDDYFANGWISQGSGAYYEAREIVRSTDLGGGHQQLILNKPFRVVQLTYSFQPNCSGTWDECKTKFGGNQINFGGHPRIQSSNPSLPRRDTNLQGGKK